MVAQIKESLGFEAKLEKSGGGAFEVFANGKKIFSKLDEGRFPTNEEIINILKK